jgi:hypothetical protein
VLPIGEVGEEEASVVVGVVNGDEEEEVEPRDGMHVNFLQNLKRKCNSGAKVSRVFNNFQMLLSLGEVVSFS